MRATCLRTQRHPVNEKSFKIGLNLQKNARIHPLSWEKTPFFDGRNSPEVRAQANSRSKPQIQLIMNLKAAKARGFTKPESSLLRVD
jgi:hypothetical protein